MAIYVPVVQTPYVFQGLFENEKFAALMAAGVLDAEAFQDAWPERQGYNPGDAVVIPQWQQAADFVQVDITDLTTDGTFTAMSTDDAKAPILRMSSFNKFSRFDEIRAGEDFRKSLEYTAGNKAAQRALKLLGKVLYGAMGVTSPSHIYDKTGSKMTVNILQQARAKMGDIGLEALHTLVMPMAVALDLYNDLINTYKYSNTMSSFLVDGTLQGILGIKNFIISDYMPQVANGTITEANNPASLPTDVFSTFFLGENSVYFAYQREMDVEFFVNTPKLVTTKLVKFNLDYVLAPRFFSYNGTLGSPTDANLQTSGSWTQKTEDHRNIKIVQILSAGYGGQ